MRKTVCISHSSDVDGLTSAAIIKLATQAEAKLVGYVNFIDSLKSVSDASEVYICDLGLSPGTIQPFSDEVNRIRGFAKVTYIDHHRKVEGSFRYRSKSGLKVIHSMKDCTAALAYNYFKSLLPKEASVLASYAALADYLEKGPIASNILNLYDRVHLYYETSILAYAVEKLGDTPEKLTNIVEELSRLKYPHEIDGVVEAASEQARRVSEFTAKVMKEGVVKRSFAHIDASGFPKGTAANLVRCVLNVPVGVAYTVNSSFAEISLRASSNYRKDLGSVVQHLASRFGGFGGGHAKASGARIPKEYLHLFLQALEDLL